MEKPIEILRAELVSIRSVWPNEAIDFTPWLETNLDYLSDVLDYRLLPETAKRESSTGSFSVDLVVENENGERVVIENQYGKSNHDHLGKVLTYLTSFDAQLAIWIVEEARAEHVKVASWLNDSTDISMFIFRLEVIRIGTSPVSPRFTLIVGPSEEGKRIAIAKGEDSGRDASRSAFYAELLSFAASKTTLHASLNGTSGPYLGQATGVVPGMYWNYGLQKHSTSVILWIERGPDWAEWNNVAYEYLLEKQQEIETSFGSSLVWQSKPENRSRKIIFNLNFGGWMDPDKWDQVIEKSVDAMIRLEKSLKDLIKEAGQHADVLGAAENAEDE
jgi:hypothetical protein